MKNKPFNRNFVRFLSILVIGLFVFSLVHANEPLDIWSYNTDDSCRADQMRIRVTIRSIGSGGMLSVGLYDDPKKFLKKKGRKQRIRIPVTEDQHMVCFNIKQPGTYAVAVYHDVDSNHKLRKRWNMTPDEPFGLSNNPAQHFGLPKFSDSAFVADDMGADIVIHLQHP